MSKTEAQRRAHTRPRRLRIGLNITVAIGMAAGLAVAFVTDGSEVIATIGQLSAGWLLVAAALSVLSWLGQGIRFAARS